MVKNIVVCAVLSVVASSLTAMPTRNELKSVQPTVNELMAADLSARKSGKQTSEGAAKRAEELANQATDEASKFLLLKGAFGLYVEGGKYDAALHVLEELKAAVKDVPDKVMADIVRAKMKKIKRSDGGAIFAYYAQLDRRLRYASVQERAEKALQANASDKVAHGRLALAKAVLGDWKGALDEFALAGGNLAKAAAAEKSGGASAADAWWQCAAAAGDDDLQDELKAHAAALYAQLIRDGKVDGLKKALAEKRVVEATGKEAEFVSEAPVPIAQPKPSQLEQPEATVQAKPMSLKFGNGVRVDFVSCPAGKMSCIGRDVDRPFKYAITRPFWIGQIPVTRQQVKALYGKVPYDIYLAFSKGPQERFPFEGDRKKAIGKLCESFGGDESVWIISPPLGHQDMDRFCRDMTEKFKRQLPKGYVVRMPTVAEWLYAFFAGKPGNITEVVASPQNSSNAMLLEREGRTRRLQEIGLKVRDDAAALRLGGHWTSYGAKPKLAAPNEWQIYDMLMLYGEFTLDTFDAERFAKFGFINGGMILKPWACTFGDEDAVKVAGSENPFFSCGTQVKCPYFGTIGIIFYEDYVPKCVIHKEPWYANQRLRLVIGPDLVKERGGK